MDATPNQVQGIARALDQVRPVAPIVFSVAIAGIASSLMTTKISLALETQNASVEAIRLVITGYPLGFILGCLTVGAIVTRIGHRATFLGLSILLTAMSLSFMATKSPMAWFLLRIGSGFGMSSIFTITESWINLESRPANRGALIAFYMILSTLGTAIGPVLLSARLADGDGAMVIAAVIFMFGCLPLVLTGRMRPVHKGEDGRRTRSDKRLPAWTLLAVAPAALAAALQTGMTNMPFGVMAPIYAIRMGYGPVDAGTLVSVFSLGGLVAQWPVGLLSDRLPRDRVLAIVSTAAALTCGLIYAMPLLPPLLLFGLVFLLGCSTLCIYPIALTYASAQVEPAYQVSLSSRLLLIYGIGTIISPALTNELMATIGPSALFAVLGTATFVVSVVSMLTLGGRRQRS
jgi:MFS family permease